MMPADEMRCRTRDALDIRTVDFEKAHVTALSKLEKLMVASADKGNLIVEFCLGDADADLLEILSDRALISSLRLLLGINGYALRYSPKLKKVRIDWYPEDVRADIEERKERLRNL